MKTAILIPLVTVILTLNVLAQTAAPSADLHGSKDYPGMPRYEGSTILLQSQQKFGELGLQIGGLRRTQLRGCQRSPQGGGTQPPHHLPPAQPRRRQAQHAGDSAQP